jgi:hypothetical protein
MLGTLLAFAATRMEPATDLRVEPCGRDCRMSEFFRRGLRLRGAAKHFGSCLGRKDALMAWVSAPPSSPKPGHFFSSWLPWIVQRANTLWAGSACVIPTAA